MDTATIDLVNTAHVLAARSAQTNSATYKAIGISLAVCSGLFIGTSFVLKKVGLLKANVKYNEEAGEGYGYLKNAYWWIGMTLMIVGEICNFVAYAFVDAILVTPLGALSVVITTILSAIFLKERLSFVGKVGCFNCIVGSVVIVMNAPEQQSAGDIQQMQKFALSPGFLAYAGIIIVGSAFIAFYLGPRYGKRSMMVYLSVCSLIGGLSVSATEGLGAAIVAQANGESQFTHWFLYVLLVFVICTLLTEIIFLNKALNIFNAALVTPTYYVYFTSSTIVASAILYQGFHGSVTSIITVVLGFLQICTGVILLQLSKSAKDVPDAAVFTGDLDQVRTVAEQEQPESEPKADAIRGTAAIIRRISVSRQKMEVEEAKKVYEEKIREQLDPIGEREQYEWDGIRRRRTIGSAGSSVRRQKTLHPPLGLTYFPEDTDNETEDIATGKVERIGVFGNIGRRAKDVLASGSSVKNPLKQHPVALTSISVPSMKSVETPPTVRSAYTELSSDVEHAYGEPSGMLKGGDSAGDVVSRATRSGSGSDHKASITWAPSVEESRPASRYTNRSNLAPPDPPPHGTTAKRQFSFQTVFHKSRGSSEADRESLSYRPSSSRSIVSQPFVRSAVLRGATEEERLGLVRGDSPRVNFNEDTSYRPLAREDDDQESWEQVTSVSPNAQEGVETLPSDDADDDSEANYQIHAIDDAATSLRPQGQRPRGGEEGRNLIPSTFDHRVRGSDSQSSSSSGSWVGGGRQGRGSFM